MELMEITEEELKNHKGCCMCFEDGYSLSELIKLDNSLEVVKQACLLLELGFKETDKFCEECFWKWCRKPIGNRNNEGIRIFWWFD